MGKRPSELRYRWLRRWQQIRKFPVQTPLDAWPGLATQPHYKAHGDLQVKNLENAMVHIR